jgi:hypothetical protein
MVLSEQIGQISRINPQRGRRLLLDPVGARKRLKKDLPFKEIQFFPQS